MELILGFSIGSVLFGFAIMFLIKVLIIIFINIKKEGINMNISNKFKK